jgi:uncharacterized membrane protein YukC
MIHKIITVLILIYLIYINISNIRKNKNVKSNAYYIENSYYLKIKSNEIINTICSIAIFILLLL